MSAFTLRDGGLSFGELRKHNVERCTEVFHPVNAWSETDWMTAVAGEVGEAANMIKKRRRGDGPDAVEVGKELADAVIYLDLLAERMGIDLGIAVAHKFDMVSDRRGWNGPRLNTPLAAPPASEGLGEPVLPSAGEFDAMVWAKSFVAHVAVNPGIATDEGAMLGWFANAMMAAYDHAKSEETDPAPAGEPLPSDGEGAGFRVLYSTVAPDIGWMVSEYFGRGNGRDVALAVSRDDKRAEADARRIAAALNRRPAPPAAAPPELREAARQLARTAERIVANRFVLNMDGPWVQPFQAQIARLRAAMAAPPPEPENAGDAVRYQTYHLAPGELSGGPPLSAPPEPEAGGTEEGVPVWRLTDQHGFSSFTGYEYQAEDWQKSCDVIGQGGGAEPGHWRPLPAPPEGE